MVHPSRSQNRRSLPISIPKPLLSIKLTLHRYIQWVAESSTHQSPIRAEVRLLNPLSASGDLETSSVVDPKSQEVFPDAMLETGFRDVQRSAPWPAAMNPVEKEQKDGTTASVNVVRGTKTTPPPESVRFQGMRLAYFCVDSDSVGDRLVLNRIVSLKEDAHKDKAKTPAY